jgi:UDP-N-acetyl-2-amino-2-deoxyglucuronate dehydrogenase
MKNFALTGIAGYIAPRHLKAIKDTGNRLVAAVDPHDSVGIIDSYFPEAAFFTEVERFDRHLEKIRRANKQEAIDFMTICSPNHLHDAHIRLAMRVGADAICEKPLVLNPWNLDVLQELEEEYGQRVWTILQLRVHPSLIELKEKLEQEKSDKRHKIRLTYITSRGTWYHYSWKGNEEQSGGIGTNIGIHFFDMLMWLFGSSDNMELYVREKNRMGGFLELPNADVEWYLSLEPEDIPNNVDGDQRTYRSISVDEDEIEFSGGFTDLHTRVYEETLKGNGFGIEDARPSIELVHKLRTMKLTENPKGLVHPSIKKLGILN